MDEKCIAKIRAVLTAMRRSPQKALDLERLAKQLGRDRVNRGKEPVWVNPDLGVYPLAISHHGGQDLPIGTRNSILNVLEDDLLAWENRLEKE